MNKQKFNQMRAMPLVQLINQPKKVLLVFAQHYLKANNTELHIIKVGK